MLGVVVPAHNEEDHLEACLRSLKTASHHPLLESEPVVIVVVLDSCDDRTADIALRHGAATLACDGRNVGAARALGANHALRAGARWLAFTDADSIVAPDWLWAQLALCSDAVCGTVQVDDWSAHDVPDGADNGRRLAAIHAAHYRDHDGHRHIHGANFGVTASAYADAGGFAPLASSEDVALVEALQASGASIVWSAAPRVVTSARRNFRALGGFGATLARLAAELPQPVPVG